MKLSAEILDRNAKLQILRILSAIVALLLLAGSASAQGDGTGNNQQFVTQQYEDFLDRQPDSQGLNAFTSDLNNGSMTRPQMIADIMGSQEFAGKGRFVAQAYIGIMARDADYNGFRGWLGWLENGGTELGLVDAFINSGEFQSNFGSNLDNGQFVTRMYENVLLRQPDSGGYNYFVGQLNNGQMTRAQVGLVFLQSTEFQKLAASQNRVSISLLYFDMLRRQPDSGGFSAYVSQLNSGTSLTSITSSFLNSSEYAARFPSSNLNSINHVIFMMEENRTFDNYFGMLNPYRKTNGYAVGDDGKEYDVDGIDDKLSTISNKNDQSTVFELFKLQTSCTDDMTSAWLESYGDVNQNNFLTTRSILMNGFVHVAEDYSNKYGDNGKRAMGYYDQRFLNYYYYMASQFALSDRWFSPVASKTIPNRIATMTGGTTQGLVHDPSKDDHLGQLSIETIFQELDQAGVSWKIYYKDTDPNDPFPATTFGYFTYSSKYMYGGCGGACIDSSHIAPLSQFSTDAQNGTLPQFSYIEPGYNDGTDEHPGSDITVGQSAVANLINTLMNSQSWKDSVFFLSYDEGGGPYDHVPPVPNHTNQNTDSSLGITTDISSIAVNPDAYLLCAPPNPPTATLHCDLQNYGSYQDPGWNSGDAAAQQGFAAQLGFRVPNIVISPFTRRHYVSHIPIDHTAIIKFVENRFIGSNAHLTARDAAQPNLLDFFDFNAVPWATPPGPPTPAGGACNPGSL